MRSGGRLPIEEALARYWKNLVPIACMPSILVIVGMFALPSWWAGPLVGALFFCACAIAAFPYFFRAAPYSYWHAAIVCFGAGCILAFPVFAIATSIARKGKG